MPSTCYLLYFSADHRFFGALTDLRRPPANLILTIFIPCRYFDSADWQMGKQKGGSATPKLQPKLEPSLPAPRRSSQLGDSH